MKKTLVDLTYYPFPNRNPQQIVSDCYSTLGYLSEMAQDTEVFFATRPVQPFEPLHHDGVHVFFTGGKALKKWQLPWRFHLFVQSLKPDYILVHGFGSAHYLIFLRFFCPKSKILLQCNGFAPKPSGWKQWVYKISDFFIDGYLFTGSENASQWYESNILSQSKIYEVMEGSTSFRFNKDQIREAKSYLCVANLIPRKDPLTVLKAFDVFLKLEPEAKLTMIYNETDLLEEVHRQIASSPRLERSVLLQGAVQHQELELVFNQHQFFVIGSHQEGSGYALVEAMACGCVPIVSDIAPHRYMTNQGECALLFTPGNEHELLHCLKTSQILDYREWQHRVMRHFDSKLSFKAIALHLEHIFQSL